MSDQKEYEFDEYRLNLNRDAEETASSGPVVLGEGTYRYQVSGDNWGSLPEGWV